MRPSSVREQPVYSRVYVASGAEQIGATVNMLAQWARPEVERQIAPTGTVAIVLSGGAALANLRLGYADWSRDLQIQWGGTLQTRAERIVVDLEWAAVPAAGSSWGVTIVRATEAETSAVLRVRVLAADVGLFPAAGTALTKPFGASLVRLASFAGGGNTLAQTVSAGVVQDEINLTASWAPCAPDATGFTVSRWAGAAVDVTVEWGGFAL